MPPDLVDFLRNAPPRADRDGRCRLDPPPRPLPWAWPGAEDVARLAAPLLAGYARWRGPEEERAARLRAACSEAGLDLVGLGSSRAVFALGEGEVLKVQYRGHRWLSGPPNLTEARRWRRAPLEEAAALAPVRAVARDGRWLVMARTAPLDRPDPAAAGRLQTRDANLAENIGLWCGRVVLHDYAA